VLVGRPLQVPDPRCHGARRSGAIRGVSPPDPCGARLGRWL